MSSTTSVQAPATFCGTMQTGTDTQPANGSLNGHQVSRISDKSGFKKICCIAGGVVSSLVALASLARGVAFIVFGIMACSVGALPIGLPMIAIGLLLYGTVAAFAAKLAQTAFKEAMKC